MYHLLIQWYLYNQFSRKDAIKYATRDMEWWQSAVTGNGSTPYMSTAAWCLLRDIKKDLKSKLDHGRVSEAQRAELEDVLRSH